MLKENHWFYSFKIKSSHIRNLCADFTVYTKLKPGGKVSPPDSYLCILRAVKITKWTYFFYLNILTRTVVKTSVKSEVLLKTCKSCLITDKGSTPLKTHSNIAQYLTAICTLQIYCYCWEQYPSLLHQIFLLRINTLKPRRKGNQYLRKALEW